MNIRLSIQIYILIYNYLILSGTAGRDLLADCAPNCIGAQSARSWLALLDDYPTLGPCSHDIIIIFIRKKRCIWIAVSLLLPTSAPDSRIMWTINILDTILFDWVQLQIKLMKHDNCYNNNNIMIHSSRILHDATVNHIKMKKFQSWWLWLTMITILLAIHTYCLLWPQLQYYDYDVVWTKPI